MRSGISTASLYPMESEQSLELLLKYGYRLFELFINAPSEMEENFLRELKNAADFYGAEFRSVHPFTSGIESMLFFGTYQRRFNDAVEFYKKYFNAAAYLGADIFVFHGENKNRQGSFSASPSLYFERFKILTDIAKTFGVTFCQENVFNFRSGSSDFIKSMVAELKGDVHFVFDIKQALLSGEDPFKMIDIMGENLVHIHLSDSNENSKCLLPGFGNFPISDLTDRLSANNYSGDIFTEVYGNSYRSIKDVESSGIFMKNLLKTT